LQFQEEDAPQNSKPAKETKPKPINTKWLKELENIILTNMTNRDFNLDYLSDKMVLSKRQLQRKIKQNTGLSANNYIRNIRLEKARRLLKLGELQTISEASYAVGFEDPHYFSTIFEKEFGVKPKSLL
jgi:AraC-like DNA-binding protein